MFIVKHLERYDFKAYQKYTIMFDLHKTNVRQSTTIPKVLLEDKV